GNDDASDPFAWCGWKNGGDAVRIGIATADAKGVWRLSDLRHAGTTVMLFPPAPGADRCLGGLYTELLPRACEQPEVGCSAWDAPTLHWLNVRKLTPTIGAVAGSLSGAEQAAAAVADGPDDGPGPSDVVGVDGTGIDTVAPGLACPAARGRGCPDVPGAGPRGRPRTRAGGRGPRALGGAPRPAPARRRPARARGRARRPARRRLFGLGGRRARGRSRAPR